MLTRASLEPVDKQPEELGEGKQDVNEESACDEKDDCVPGEVMVKKKKKIHIKGNDRNISRHWKYK